LTPGGWAVCTLALLLIGNRLVLRHAVRGPLSWLYWSIQGCNLASIVFLIAVGLPGLPRETRIMDWAVALLFLWHIAENHLRRQAILGAEEFRSLLRAEEQRAAEAREQREDGPGPDDPTDPPAAADGTTP
jgi:hypothetical protein